MIDQPEKTVLIVDDDAAACFIFKYAIKRQGYRIYTAANGREGIESLHTIPKPGLILLDLMMPVMNGWEFLDELEKNPDWRMIPVVVLTAFTTDVNAIRARQVLSKPIDLGLLLETVAHWCAASYG